MTSLVYTVDQADGATIVRLSGRLVTDALQQVERGLTQISATTSEVAIDLSGLEAFDTGGALMIVSLRETLARQGVKVDVRGASADQARLLQTVEGAGFDGEDTVPEGRGLSDLIEGVGRSVVAGLRDAGALLSFLGLIIVRFARALVHPTRFRLTATFAQAQQTGLNAVPIIALMGFLIGIVLAFQGAAQLRQFGAEVFVVDLIAVSVLRELGILLTAVIIAGRSGSAFAAAIGSMKVNEEIDAMQTLGLDPIEVLVLPRIIALTLMLPVLGFVANVCALTGGALMSWIELGISPGMFVTRFYENTDVWHLIVGMVKAPFFAIIIGVIACWQGLQVGGSAESVGQRTTASVVQAIFMVIVIDAIFSIFFAELGV